MNTYMVSIADRETGLDQRILVRARTAEGMQEYVDKRPVGTKGEVIFLEHPVVIGVTEVKDPHTRTVFPVMASTP